MSAKPKFKVGQVVMIVRGSAKVFPMWITNIEFHFKGMTGKEEWRYIGSGMFEWETNLRPLTAREAGRPARSKRT